MRYGYARISGVEPDPEREIRALHFAVPNDYIVIEKVAGQARSRPDLEKLLETIPKGAELYVFSVDRIARDARHLLDIVKALLAKEVILVVLEDRVYPDDWSARPIKIETRFGPGSTELRMLEMFASMETDLASERTKLGLKTTENKGGRRPSLSEEQITELRKLFDKGTTQVGIARELGVSQATVSRYIADHISKKKRAAPIPVEVAPAARRPKRKEYEKKVREKRESEAHESETSS